MINEGMDTLATNMAFEIWMCIEGQREGEEHKHHKPNWPWGPEMAASSPYCWAIASLLWSDPWTHTATGSTPLLRSCNREEKKTLTRVINHHVFYDNRGPNWLLLLSLTSLFMLKYGKVREKTIPTHKITMCFLLLAVQWLRSNHWKIIWRR